MLFVLPLAASLAGGLAASLNFQGWLDLFAHPQLWPALRLSLSTGSAAFILSFLFACMITASLYETGVLARMQNKLGVMLALPHLGFALGLGFLIMPSGIFSRIIAGFAGWQTPPPWVTTHDPGGLALIAALVLKETPFLIFVMSGLILEQNTNAAMKIQSLAGKSLGHAPPSLWLRVHLPQLLPRMIWPLVITFVYAATVVDMALVLGPTEPGTLATVAWADINDAEPWKNARGAAGAMVLTLSLMTAAVLTGLMLLTARAPWRKFLTKGLTREMSQFVTVINVATLWQIMSLFYVALIVGLAFISVAALWTFPHMLPQIWSSKAWMHMAAEPRSLVTSLTLAITAPATALAFLLLWFETQPPARDRPLLVLSALAIGLPALLLGLGQYQAFLRVGLTGTATGLFLAHLMPVAAYMVLVLQGPWRAYDLRWRDAASSLGASRWRHFMLIKLPLLKTALWSSGAVGFAVSFSQYVPAQLVAAGRYSTLPTDAVTLSSGANRALTAAFALTLMLPPALVFAIAVFNGGKRWKTA